MDYFNKEFFENMGFVSKEENVYEKEIIAQRMQTSQGIFENKKIIKIIVLETDPVLGTNLEYFEDNRVALTGYWHDHEDFTSTFN